MRSRTMRASTGAMPPVETATTSGERSTIAGHETRELRIVDDVDKQVARAPPAAAIGALTSRSLGRGNREREPSAEQLCRQKSQAARPPTGHWRPAVRARASTAARPPSRAPRQTQQPDLALGNLAAADDQHAPAAQVGEDGESTRIWPLLSLRGRGCRTRASARRTASPRHRPLRRACACVCQSPIDT